MTPGPYPSWNMPATDATAEQRRLLDEALARAATAVPPPKPPCIFCKQVPVNGWCRCN